MGDDMTATIGTAIYQDEEIAQAIKRHKKLLADTEKQIVRLREAHQPAEQTRSARTTSYAKLTRACEYRDRLQSELDSLKGYSTSGDNVVANNVIGARRESEKR